MMNLKKFWVACTAVLMLMGLSVTAYAAETSANNAALEEGKAIRLERMEERLEALVSAGSLTQEQVDDMLAAMIQRQENCDGTGCGNQGQCDGTGAGFCGGNSDRGQGCGMGRGRGGMGCVR